MTKTTKELLERLNTPKVGKAGCAPHNLVGTIAFEEIVSGVAFRVFQLMELPDGRVCWGLHSTIQRKHSDELKPMLDEDAQHHDKQTE